VAEGEEQVPAKRDPPAEKRIKEVRKIFLIKHPHIKRKFKNWEEN
jgi:hypothetical protein